MAPLQLRVTVVVALPAVTAALFSGCGGSGGSAAVSTQAAVATTTLAAAPARPAPRWKAWLCKPGQKVDWCNANLDVTVVSADGSRRIVHAPAHPKQPIDCFFVYPTVSMDRRGNSDLDPGQEEKQVAIVEASRFRQACRVFAPLYRQRTAYSRDLNGSRELAYSDVRTAWRDYLAHDNKGRGVVLLGHSQGAGILERLIREEIEGSEEVRGLLVSAVLLGGGVTVAKDSDTGGSFERVPACRERHQTGCVVAYATWDRTPPAGSGGGIDPAQRSLCVNPAKPAGGRGPVTPVFPWFAPQGIMSGELSPPVDTLWISFPGKYTARCVTRGSRSWLLIENVGPVGDRRDLVQGVLGPSAGLHAADVNIALPQLVGLVREQGAAWAEGR